MPGSKPTVEHSTDPRLSNSGQRKRLAEEVGELICSMMDAGVDTPVIAQCVMDRYPNLSPLLVMFAMMSVRHQRKQGAAILESLTADPA